MNDDPTPINARPKRRPPETLEDLTLALRDRLLWPLEDRFLALGDRGRAAVAGGAAVLVALGIGIGAYSLADSESQQPPVRQVAVTPTSAPQATKPEPKPTPDPTLQGAAPVFEGKEPEDPAEVSGPEPTGGSAATSSQTGNAATDTISSTPAASPAGASASASSAAAGVEGPPAGPAAIAVARKFAGAFVVYETGGDKGLVRRSFKATATPELTKALLQRPPRQPTGVEVPKAKVLNVVPAPSQGEVYPVSVSLLRVGATSELRLEMEQLKDKRWRVVNVLG